MTIDSPVEYVFGKVATPSIEWVVDGGAEIDLLAIWGIRTGG